MSDSMSPLLPEQFLDPERITLARTRRGMTKADLARELGVTPRSITRYESDGAPLSAASALSSALEFPIKFFSTPPTAQIEANGVNFRAARRAGARQRAAAVAAGAIGIEVGLWISERFNLPPVAVPRRFEDDPALAARILRANWALGVKPLPNAVQLVEAHGVRVFTLPPIAEQVDAFSCWHGDVPYIFLSRRRSPERMRFDVAHELGHLVMHRAKDRDDTAQEREADQFASEFLMPREALPVQVRRNPTTSEVLEARARLKVSAMALVRALHHAKRMSDWHYRQMCIDLSGRGYRSGEPGGMPSHEMSRVFPQVLKAVGAKEIAEDLLVPAEEVRALTFGVELRVTRAERGSTVGRPVDGVARPLRVVRG
ncbi:ImmA/IrrE family metallo-endopeptidase [Gordonia sp. (in: high G+C Gram-positive bacteria)]|uniref:ImmA/IrrE family metallo-endopeptidase n=1 Tax=Gordonia sp. (in: high G+C Gram-positive bacteria) TaxID=84139 RepID=UPI003F99750C